MVLKIRLQKGILEVNKIYPIIGGAVVASLAAGATGGYLYAKAKFAKEFDARLDIEMNATKKYYSLQIMQAKEGKDKSPAEVAAELAAAEEDPDFEGLEDAEDDDEVIEQQRAAFREKLKKEGETARVNYQGYAKPELADIPVKEHNIFADKPRDRRPPLPPRDETTGKFLAKDGMGVVRKDEPATEVKPVEGLYSIEKEDFLANPFDYAQENVRYFPDEDTIIDFAGEVVENFMVGEHNLEGWKETNPEAGDILCVRNETLEHDYEIAWTTESLTEYLGLTES